MKTSKILLFCLIVVILLSSGLYLIARFRKTVNEAPKVTAGPILGERDKLVIGVDPASFFGQYPETVSAADSGLSYYSDVYEPLVRFDGERRLEPGAGLALSWTNPDSLTWRFVLNPAAKFWDGTSVHASDVKFTYETITKNNYQIAPLFPSIKEVKVVDDQTIDIITATPNPVLANKLAYLYVLSENDVTKNGLVNPMGSGPYKTVAVNKDNNEFLHLVRNEDYWGQKARIKEVIVRGVRKKAESEPDSASYIEALLAGQIDMAPIIYSKETVDKVTGNGFKLVQWNDPTVCLMSINTLRDNPLKNSKLRQAIRYAFNMADFEAAYPDSITPASQIVASPIFGFNPNIPNLTYDIEKAKQLLIEANIDQSYKIQILDVNPKVGQIVEKQLKAIGLNVELLEVSDEEYFKRLTSGDYDLVYSAFSTTSADASEPLEQLYHTKNSTLGLYNSGYSNSTVDGLIEQAGSILNMKERQKILQEALKIVTLDDVAYIPLFTYKSSYIAPKNLFWEPRLDGNIIPSMMAGLKQ